MLFAQVLPVYLKNLPIVEDHEEDEVVFTCLHQLMRDENVFDTGMQARVIQLFAEAAINQDVKEGL